MAEFLKNLEEYKTQNGNYLHISAQLIPLNFKTLGQVIKQILFSTWDIFVQVEIDAKDTINILDNVLISTKTDQLYLGGISTS